MLLPQRLGPWLQQARGALRRPCVRLALSLGIAYDDAHSPERFGDLGSAGQRLGSRGQIESMCHLCVTVLEMTYSLTREICQ